MSDTYEANCDICGGPLGQERWRGFPPICSKCEMESLHDTPGLTAPYIDAYNRLRDIRNMLADSFRIIEADNLDLTEGEPIVEVIDQIEDLAQTFLDSAVTPLDADWQEV